MLKPSLPSDHRLITSETLTVCLQLHTSADAAAASGSEQTGTAQVELALLRRYGQLCGWYNIQNLR